MDQLTVTREQIEAAMQQWTSEQRAGLCMSAEEVMEMTAEQLSQARADWLWDRLTQQTVEQAA